MTIGAKRLDCFAAARKDGGGLTCNKAIGQITMRILLTCFKSLGVVESIWFYFAVYQMEMTGNETL